MCYNNYLFVNIVPCGFPRHVLGFSQFLSFQTSNCLSQIGLQYLPRTWSLSQPPFKIPNLWTLHNSLWIKPTDALNSNFIGITTLHVLGSLSAHHQEFPTRIRSRMERSSILLLVANCHHNCKKYTKADVRLRTPDDGQKGCPKHV